MPTVTIKISTVFVSTKSDLRVYQSLDDVPPELRKKMDPTKGGSRSATILIADRRGREELVRAIGGESSNLPLRVMKTRKRQKNGTLTAAAAKRYRLELILVTILALLLWLVTMWK